MEKKVFSFLEPSFPLHVGYIHPEIDVKQIPSIPKIDGGKKMKNFISFPFFILDTFKTRYWGKIAYKTIRANPIFN